MPHHPTTRVRELSLTMMWILSIPDYRRVDLLFELRPAAFESFAVEIRHRAGHNNQDTLGPGHMTGERELAKRGFVD